ncbi:hypothetical protein OPV22_009721 [Ensete ventricosum]|uniref:Uncharacterized protein n=1 Tax=Ensete ventricosum TaxID=4639 RepID=A0AAV8RHL5_ENSVE|nr:hypothetical protein OPV22_009721 [Ensete ventricosum]RWW18356.1 hypothetical protein GW17_00017667 [Ensete ventricosum]RWW70298.1 hypothetical protein BHE74_00022012 [Ensete ventricosum]
MYTDRNFVGMQLLFRLVDVVPYDKRRLCAVYDENVMLGIFDVDPGPPGRGTMIACHVMSCLSACRRVVYPPTWFRRPENCCWLPTGCNKRTADWNRDDIHLFFFVLGTTHSVSVDAGEHYVHFVYQYEARRLRRRRKSRCSALACDAGNLRGRYQ